MESGWISLSVGSLSVQVLIGGIKGKISPDAVDNGTGISGGWSGISERRKRGWIVDVRATLLFGSQHAMSVCLRYPIPVGHCQ